MPSRAPEPNALHAALRRILRPLARILLRNGIAFAEFAEQAKRAFVESAENDFRVAGRRPSISRSAILTGLTRKEVSRLSKLASGDGADDTRERFNRAARVISGWVRDVRFAQASGAPAGLEFEGDWSFSLLVRLYGGDVPPRAVLDELLRVRAVEQDEAGRLHLRTRAYVPSGDAEDKLGILGVDVAELITTIDHNITRGQEPAWFQRKVSYDSLPPGYLPELRARVEREAQRLLEDFDHEMAAHDLDLHPAAADDDVARRTASLGVYFYQDEGPEPAPDPEPDDEE